MQVDALLVVRLLDGYARSSQRLCSRSVRAVVAVMLRQDCSVNRLTPPGSSVAYIPSTGRKNRRVAIF